MRILLDECVDRRLAPLLSPHEIKTAGEMGWSGLRNSELLTAAQAAFEVLVTVDQNLRHQQPIDSFDIAMIVIVSPSNRLEDLVKLLPAVLEALPDASAGTAIEVP